MRKLTLGCLLVLTAVLTGCASAPFVVVTPLAEQPAQAPTLVIGEIVDGLSADAPQADHPTPELLGKLREFLSADLSGLVSGGSASGEKGKPFAAVSVEAPDTSGSARNLVLTTKVLSYQRGSRAARYFIGFGAGKGELLVQFTLREAGRPDDLFVGNFKGHITMGAFGGSNDAPYRQVSREFAKYLRQNWR